MTTTYNDLADHMLNEDKEPAAPAPQPIAPIPRPEPPIGQEQLLTEGASPIPETKKSE